MEPMTIADIIKAAHDGNPTEVQDAFNDVIQAKMAAALDARREEMVNSLYGSSEDDEEEFEYDEEEFEYDDSEVEADDDDYDLEELDTEEIEDEDI